MRLHNQPQIPAAKQTESASTAKIYVSTKAYMHSWTNVYPPETKDGTKPSAFHQAE